MGGLGCTGVSPPKAGLLDGAVAGGSGGRDGGGGEASGDAAGPAGDGKTATDVATAADVPHSGGGSDASAGGSGGGGGNDAGAGGSGGVGGIGGSAGGSGGVGGIGGSAGGSGGSGGSVGPDAATDVRPVDAPGTCSADKECPSQTPLCLGNRCAKCATDADCVGRSGPACAGSGMCVGCTANSYCTGSAATCDIATNQCVGCVKRSDCAGACLTCSTTSVCTAVKNLDDPSGCPGTCDSTGACKAKQGQACTANSDCAGGLPCVDGFCCESACTGKCTSCAVTHGKCTNTTSPRTGQTCGGTSPCNATCNGSSPDCVPASTSTPCGTTTCLNSTQLQLAGTCNSQGTCSQSTQPCTLCLSTTNACADCTPGVDRRCSAGVPQKCDTSGHWANDTACGTGQVCSGTGNCGCQTNWTSCGRAGNTCYDSYNDSHNCGSAAGCLDCTASGKTCSAGGCICPVGNPNLCGNTCTNFSTDNSNCGGCGAPCNSAQSCLSGICTCHLGSPACGGCLGWDFDSGIGLWAKRSPLWQPGTQNGATAVQLASSAHSHAGAHALEVDATTDTSLAQYFVEVGVPICTNGSAISVTGYTFSAWIYIDGPALGPNAQLAVEYSTPSGPGDNDLLLFSAGEMTTGSWMQARLTLVSSYQPDTLYIYFEPGLDSGVWSGSIYIDDVQLFK